MLLEKSLFVTNVTPSNNQIMAAYLFAKKLVFDAIGKKQVKMMLKINARQNQLSLNHANLYSCKSSIKKAN
jgi:hypothetical protein